MTYIPKYNHPLQVILNTLVDYPRLDKLRDFLIETEALTGDIAEVGVYKGGTAYLICAHTKKHVHLIDTFEGLPTVSIHDTHHTGDFKNTALEVVNDLLKSNTSTSPFTLTKGLFQDIITMPQYDTVQYALVHIDVDIYPSVKACLEYFYPRMVPGGIIVMDDYGSPNCPGAKLAGDEFMVDKPEVIEATTQCQAIIRKI